MMIDIFIILILTLQVINTIVLFYFGAFLVSLRDRIENKSEDPIGLSIEENSRSLTWDEKLEREMDELQRIRRQQSGLTDA